MIEVGTCYRLEQRVKRLEEQRWITSHDTVIFADSAAQAAKYGSRHCIVIVDDLRPDKEALVTD